MSPIKWVMTVPVVSTGHLTKEEHDEILHYADGVSVLPTGAGFLIYIGDVNDPQECDGSLKEVVLRLRELDFDVDWVRFDSDGDVIPGVPTYNW